LEEVMSSPSKTSDKVTKVNPRITIGESDVKGLKGKGIGDKCEFMIKGHIVSASEPSEWEKKEGKKENTYVVEIEKIENYSSRRI
jgi:hypothetical protein